MRALQRQRTVAKKTPPVPTSQPGICPRRALCTLCRLLSYSFRRLGDVCSQPALCGLWPEAACDLLLPVASLLLPWENRRAGYSCSPGCRADVGGAAKQQARKLTLQKMQSKIVPTGLLRFLLCFPSPPQPLPPPLRATRQAAAQLRARPRTRYSSPRRVKYERGPPRSSSRCGVTPPPDSTWQPPHPRSGAH